MSDIGFISNYTATKNEATYWKILYGTIKQNIDEDREINDLEYYACLCAAAVTHRSKEQFVNDYWKTYWELKYKF